MSSIRPNAPFTVSKTFGATPRAWNGTRHSLRARVELLRQPYLADSDLERIARDTRATNRKMKSLFRRLIIACAALPVAAAVPAALMKTAAGNRRSLFAGGTPGTTVSVLPISYGDLFGDAEVGAGAAGDGALASPGFTLSNSTSKMRVEFGPISPPVPPGP